VYIYIGISWACLKMDLRPTHQWICCENCTSPHVVNRHKWWSVRVAIPKCPKNEGLVNSSTLWLCQNSYWKWPFIVDFPMKNCDFPICSIVMLVYQRVDMIYPPWSNMALENLPLGSMMFQSIHFDWGFPRWGFISCLVAKKHHAVALPFMNGLKGRVKHSMWGWTT